MNKALADLIDTKAGSETYQNRSIHTLVYVSKIRVLQVKSFAMEIVYKSL